MIELKKEVIKYAQKLNSTNLSPLRSGNVSVRVIRANVEGFFLTPSGKRYEDLIPEDIVFLSLKEEYDFGDYKFDQIFVCISPGYIPPLQWHMIGTFMTVYEEITGNVVDLNEFNKKYEIEKYYAQVTDYITKGTTIGKGSPSARFIY